METQYTNIRRILDKIMRHPLLVDISLETAVDYTVDFIRLVGVPTMFIDKHACITIEKYKGKLPIDFHKMIQVRNIEENSFIYRYSTDSFHFSPDKRSSVDYTYKIQGDYIYTSTEEIPVEIAYSAIHTDDCGLPMIIDNSSFTRALELYIKKQWFTILFDMGKINPAVLQNTQREYAWAVGDCEAEFHRLSLDKMESFMNSWRTLLIRDNQHSVGFSTDGSKERLKIH